MTSETKSLRARVINAGAWSAAAYGVELIIRFGSNLLLARLLFPQAFGLVAASMSIIVGLGLISDVGVRAYIIHHPQGEHPEFLRTLWTFQAFRGVGLWLLLCLFCLALASPHTHGYFAQDSAFNNEMFPSFTAILGFQLVLGGLESTAVPLNLRQLNYKAIAPVDLWGRFLPVPFMLGWALIQPTVWILAVGGLVGAAVRALLTHVVVPGPAMAFRWNREYIVDAIRFGKWITLSSVATFVASQSDVMLLGAFFSGSYLGLYFIAKSLLDGLEGLLERLNATLTLPVLGEVIRRDSTSLQRNYYRFRYPIEIFSSFTAAFLFVGGPDLIRLLYDSRYQGAGHILSVLSFGLFLYPFALVRSAFTAIGDTRSVAFASVLQALSLVLLLLVGILMAGNEGAIIGIASSRSISSFLLILLALRHRWTNWIKELRVLGLYGGGLAIFLLCHSMYAAYFSY